MLELKHVSKYYHSNGVTSKGIDDVSIKFNKGEIVAITGESGSGKSTLLNVISRLDTFDEGEIYFKGNETSYFDVHDMDQFRKNKIGFIFQNYNIIDSYTVLQNVELPLLINGVSKIEARKKALDILNRVGLAKRAHHRGSELSGGEKQRCVIARALAQNSEILACDEPTGNLDQATGREIMELIKEIGKDKLVLIVTHDFNQIEDLVTRKIKIHDGHIVEDVIFEEIEEDKYEELDLDYKPIEKKTNLKIALSNLFSTPKKTILSFLVFLVIAFFSLSIFQTMNFEINNDKSSYVFAYRSSDKYILYDKEYKSLDLNKIKSLSDTYTTNAFYENNIINLRGVNSTSYSYQIQAVYEKYPNIDITEGSDPKDEFEFVLYLPTNYDYSYKVGDSYYTYQYFTNIIVNESLYDTFARASYTYKISGIGYSDNLEKPIISKNSYLEEYARYNSVYENLSVSNDLKENQDFTITYDFSRKTHIANYNSSKYKNIQNKDIIYFNYRLFNLDSIPNTIPDSYQDNYVYSYDNTRIENLLVIGYDFYEYISDTFEASIYSTDKNIETSLQNAGFDYFSTTVKHSNNEVSQYIYSVELYLIIIGCVVILEILYLISYVIIKKIYESKSESYTIFRTLGVTVNDMKRQSKYEILVQSILSTILIYLGMIILGNIFKSNSFFKMFTSYSFLFSILYFIITILMGLLIANRFVNKLFKKSVRESLREAK